MSASTHSFPNFSGVNGDVNPSLPQSATVASPPEEQVALTYEQMFPELAGASTDLYHVGGLLNDFDFGTLDVHGLDPFDNSMFDISADSFTTPLLSTPLEGLAAPQQPPAGDCGDHAIDTPSTDPCPDQTPSGHDLITDDDTDSLFGDSPPEDNGPTEDGTVTHRLSPLTHELPDLFDSLKADSPILTRRGFDPEGCFPSAESVTCPEILGAPSGQHSADDHASSSILAFTGVEGGHCEAHRDFNNSSFPGDWDLSVLSQTSVTTLTQGPLNLDGIGGFDPSGTSDPRAFSFNAQFFGMPQWPAAPQGPCVGAQPPAPIVAASFDAQAYQRDQLMLAEDLARATQALGSLSTNPSPSTVPSSSITASSSATSSPPLEPGSPEPSSSKRKMGDEDEDEVVEIPRSAWQSGKMKKRARTRIVERMRDARRRDITNVEAPAFSQSPTTDGANPSSDGLPPVVHAQFAVLCPHPIRPGSADRCNAVIMGGLGKVGDHLRRAHNFHETIGPNGKTRVLLPSPRRHWF
ncbi:hypothetical protein NMY22_g7005 [Coprinellus aureogranulatus]|nr:hypothetical protein NMY22_g7005 [Coprinellus aureogranulatus]